jgi:hypothetical protein
VCKVCFCTEIRWERTWYLRQQLLRCERCLNARMDNKVDFFYVQKYHWFNSSAHTLRSIIGWTSPWRTTSSLPSSMHGVSVTMKCVLRSDRMRNRPWNYFQKYMELLILTNCISIPTATERFGGQLSDGPELVVRLFASPMSSAPTLES